MTDLLENETNPVTFICGATGKPIPTISWYFNNILLNATDHNITSTVDGVTVESSLTIFNAQSSDVGTYTCHADNVFGSDRSSGVLTVNGNKLLCINICSYVISVIITCITLLSNGSIKLEDMLL